MREKAHGVQVCIPCVRLLGNKLLCYLFSPRFPNVCVKPMLTKGVDVFTDLQEPYTCRPYFSVDAFCPKMLGAIV